MINTDENAQPSITPNGAVELDEAQLEQVDGGASDYLLVIDGVKGESRTRSTHVGGINVALADGSVR